MAQESSQKTVTVPNKPFVTRYTIFKKGIYALEEHVGCDVSHHFAKRKANNS